MAAYSDILFGKIALKNKLITGAQLHEALALMGRQRGMSLAEALVRGGFLSPRKARKVQKAQALSQFVRAEKIFARIALERRLADVPTLQALFERQQALGYRARLGQLLQEQGRISAEQHESIVEEQLLRLAEDTAQIEEAGFGEEREAGAGDAEAKRLDEMSHMGAATDLEGSVLRKAVGPRGMLRREAINRTLPAFVVPQLDEPAARAQGAGPGIQGGAYDDVEIEEEEEEPLSASGSRLDGRPLPPSGPLDPQNLVGTTIASRYRVEEKVGLGGMGTVYRAQHCLMEKTVALKVLHPSLVGSKLSLERFRLEIRAASRFQHKNVVQIYDAGQGEGGLFYMAMEFAEGETLERVLEQGPLPLPRALRILRQVLSAVTEAHEKGIVHRDLKSGNIMIVPDRVTPDLVKVMDFGLAKIALESSEGPLERGEGLYRTQEGVVTGTPQYMSPEQASGEPVDHRSDLYSLGVIMFEMLSGQLPFKSNTPMGYLGKHIVEPPPRLSEVVPERRIPRALEDLVLRLLAKRPAERYQSAKEVLRALEAALEAGESGRSAAVAPVGPPGDARSDRVRRRGDKGSGRAARPEGSSQRTALRAGTEGPADDRSRSERAPRQGGRSERAPRQPGRSERVAPPPSPPEPAPPRREVARTILAPAPPPITEAAPAVPPPPAQPPARRSPWGLLAGLLLLLVLTASGSVWLALNYRPGPGASAGTPTLEQALEEARGCLERGDPAAALAILDPLVAAHADHGPARELQRQASREQERLSLIAEADRLAGEYRAGTSARAAAEKALALYREAIALRDDQAVRRRREALELELQGPSQPPPTEDPLAQRRAALDAALERGDLKEARRLFEGLAAQLGQNQQVYAAHLEAEEKLVEAQGLLEAGRKELARQLLEQARGMHPVRERRAWIEQELLRLDRERQQAGQRERAEEALGEARAAALALDRARLDAALLALRGLLGELPAELAEPARAAAEVFSGATPLLEDVRNLRAELDRLQALELVPRLEASAAEERARVLRTRAEQLADPELARGLGEALSRDSERATVIAARARTAPAPTPVDQDAQRFAAAVEKVKALPPPPRESAQTVLERLQQVSELQAYPGYEAGPPEARSWVEAELGRLVQRQKVWAELGPDFVRIPGGRWECPTDRRAHELPAVYYAAATEVTCAEWNGFMRATGAQRPQSFPGPTSEPVTGITLREARRYCEWRSKGLKKVRFRLPSEAEWERAARGPEGAQHPWGDAFEPWRAGDVALERVVRVKSFPKDQNAWGLFDLVGNVQELTSSTRPGGMIVLKGGGVGVARKDAGAGSVHLVREGSEASPGVGLRLFAEER